MNATATILHVITFQNADGVRVKISASPARLASLIVEQNTGGWLAVASETRTVTA